MWLLWLAWVSTAAGLRRRFQDVDTGAPDIGLPAGRKHKPVIWVHVHKACGTSMCSMAKLNGEALMSQARDGQSCNVNLVDDYRFWMPTGRPDCADREMMQRASGFTWSQIEHPLTDEEFCPDEFFYGTIIRHPVTAALSQVNYIDVYQLDRWSPYEWRKLIACLEDRQAGHAAACAELDLLPKPDQNWVFFDNFLVRMFGGLSVWNLPAGAINAAHRELALSRLSSLDLVLTAEQFDSNQTRTALRQAFRWDRFEPTYIPVNANAFKPISFTADDVKRIERLNMHDMIIFNNISARLSGH